MNEKDLYRANIMRASKIVILSPPVEEVQSYGNNENQEE